MSALNKGFPGAGLCSVNFNLRTGYARDRFDNGKRPVRVKVLHGSASFPQAVSLERIAGSMRTTPSGRSWASWGHLP